MCGEEEDYIGRSIAAHLQIGAKDAIGAMALMRHLSRGSKARGWSATAQHDRCMRGRGSGRGMGVLPWHQLGGGSY